MKIYLETVEYLRNVNKSFPSFAETFKLNKTTKLHNSSNFAIVDLKKQQTKKKHYYKVKVEEEIWDR